MSRILLFETLSVNEESDKTTAGSSSTRETERNQPKRASEYALREPFKYRLTHIRHIHVCINGMHLYICR